MSSKIDYSKRILKILGKKTAISLPELKEKLTCQPIVGLGDQQVLTSTSFYAIARSFKNLKDAGLVEQIPSPQNEYARLTSLGRKKIHTLELDNETTLVNISWDGLWRIILLDLPEKRKSERESLRYLLKKAGFVCLKNSIWISPYPFECLFTNIKKDLGLTTEMMIIVTQFLDEETKKFLFETFGK